MITPNTIIYTGCLVFIIISTYCGDRASQRLFCEFTIRSWPKFFLAEENQIMFDRRGYLSFFKNFAAQYFFLPFMACDKHWSFLIWYVKYRMSSCTTCLIKKSQTLPCLCLWIWLNSWDQFQSWPRFHQQIREFFSSNDQNEASKLPYLCNHQWTHPTLFESFALTSKCSEIFVLEITSWMP